MERKMTVGVAICLVGLFLAGPAAATVTVYESGGSGVYGIGEIVVSEIRADIPLSEPILGWGIDLNWDESVIDLIGFSVDPIWFEATTTADSDLDVGALAFPTGHTGDVLLVELTFITIGLGHSDIAISDDNPPDLTEGFAIDNQGFAEVDYIPGIVWVVPEPGTLWLLGLVGALAARRRRAARE